MLVNGYKIEHGANLCGADLRGADLRKADLHGANLHGADLRKANLRKADLCGANLRKADLHGADLRWADFRWADLRGSLGIVQAGYANGYFIFGWIHDNNIRIHVGCHLGDMTIKQGYKYWKGKKDRREIVAALDYIKAVIDIRGWIMKDVKRA